MKKVLIILLVVFTLLICGILLFNTNVEVEYVPETEIADVDLRKTMITLFFQNKESKQLQKETRLIDSKNLLLDPYTELIGMLLEGPESSFLANTVPEGTKLLGCELVGDCLNVNLSKEFEENASEDEVEKENSIFSIVNTVTELNEVNHVKFFIEGEEVEELSEVERKI